VPADGLVLTARGPADWAEVGGHVRSPFVVAAQR
jgi:hypothetical protein